MTDEEYLERDLSFAAMDAAYFIDVKGLDNLLRAVMIHVRNPEQELQIERALRALENKK